ncbi:MAG: type II secretion system F family protein [Lentisphaeria bacterium]|jgi:type IV pilus assembly protein PilC|nr:type II secretion system F family protein [Lentisphaeria bacterium]
MATSTPSRSQPPVQQNAGQQPREKFEYLAMDDGGRELRGTVMAVDEMAAVAKLTAQGLFPIEVWNKKQKAPAKAAGKTAPRRQRTREDMARSSTPSRARSIGQILGLGNVISQKNLAPITRQLSTMLDAGLPLLLSLRTLQEQCGRRQKPIKSVLQDLVNCVESGMPLSEALSLHPRSFSQLYVGLVRAGEAAGALEEVLSRLAEYMEKNLRMRKKIKSGMTYPVVVLVIAVTITLGLMMGVVPQFADMFNELLEGIPLPALTAFVIAMSKLLVERFSVFFGIIFAGFVMLKIFLRTRVGTYAFDWAIVTFPPVNGLVRKIAVARFCSTLGTLLDAGVPILDALGILAETSTNELVKRTVRQIHSCVSEGDKIARPLGNCKVFPKMVVRMVEVGEKTGALPSMLKRIAKTYEEEVEMALEAMISLIEPLMICFLAVMIGGIVLALFLPLIKIIETLGG